MKDPTLVDADLAIKGSKEKIAKASGDLAVVNQRVAAALNRLAEARDKLKEVVETLEKPFKG